MSWLTQYVDHPYLFAICLLAALPILWQYFQWFFGDVRGFVEDAINGGMPDWLALLRGKYYEGEWAEIKIVFFIFVCIAFVASFYKLIVNAFY